MNEAQRNEAREIAAGMFAVDSRLSAAEANENHNLADAVRTMARMPADYLTDYVARLRDTIQGMVERATPALEREDPELARRLGVWVNEILR